MASTNRDLILDALRLSSEPLDDDELARRCRISPRQTVNQICRTLETAGLLRRTPGPNGKLVNSLNGEERKDATLAGVVLPSKDGIAAPQADVVHEGAAQPPGNSSEQRAAERTMLDLLGSQLGLRLDPAHITVPPGARVEIDGADAHNTVLVECWAHQGAPKAAQRHKVLSDAFKLTWISSTMSPRPRLILCLSDPLAAAPFVPAARTWGARAIADLGIAVEVVELPPAIRAGILAAQQRQFR